MKPNTSQRWSALRERVHASWSQFRETPWDRRRIVTVVGLGMIAFMFFGVGAATAAWTRACAGGCPTADQIADFAPRQATEVYDANGEVLGMFYRERR